MRERAGARGAVRDAIERARVTFRARARVGCLWERREKILQTHDFLLFGGLEIDDRILKSS